MQELLTNKTIEKLKYDLVREGLITFDALLKAEELSQSSGVNLGQAFIDSGLMDEQVLLEFLESKLHIPYVNLEDYTLDKNCIPYISAEDARKYRIIPLFKIEGVLTLAMADPMDLFALNTLINSLNLKIEPVICSEKSIIKAINTFYPSEIKEVKNNGSLLTPEFDWNTELNSLSFNDEQINKIIFAILKQSYLENTNEIVFDMDKDGIIVGFKTDDEITVKGTIPLLLVPRILFRIKHLSGLDITVTGIPQCGHLEFEIDNQEINACVYTFPTVNGERVVIKLHKLPETLDNKPVKPNKKDFIRESLKKAGLLLVCGKRQSGRTSFVYSILQEAVKNKRCVLTCESVIKSKIQGAIQCELNEKVGFDMNKALKHLEFQNPDIIYFEDMPLNQNFNYFANLVQNGKLVITELYSKNTRELIKNLSLVDLNSLLAVVTCIIFINNLENIDVLDRIELENILKNGV